MFNPFINGVADSHDRHRDMRLDVDNMSYEVEYYPLTNYHPEFLPLTSSYYNAMVYQELLALEERIGNVNTGLSEATILGSMKQRKYDSFCGGLSSDLEPCCICRVRFISMFPANIIPLSKSIGFTHSIRSSFPGGICNCR